MKVLYSLHRWLGISAGVMLVIWYASGLYVHWRALPSVMTQEERNRLLGEPFNVLERRKDFTEILQSYHAGPVQEIRLRRAGSRLIYEIRPFVGSASVFDAQTGALLSPISQTLAREIAQGFVPTSAITATVLLETPDVFSTRLSMPVYRITFADAEGTTIYIDPDTASVLSRTRTRERMYYVFGSIPHFLNLPLLRKNKALQDSLLFALDACAAAVVLSGMAVLTWMLLRRGFLGGLGSGHPALRRWHYLFGLVFSIPTVLFIASGWFYVTNGSPPPARISPKAEELKVINQVIDLRSSRLLPIAVIAPDLGGANASTIMLKQVLGVPVYHVQASDARNYALRGDTGQALTIDQAWRNSVAKAFLGDWGPIKETQYLTGYDDYYYARDGRFPVLPVYRLQGNDPAKTLLYLSPVTGEVIGRASDQFRFFRWLIVGFHAWDWPFLLERPLLRDTVIVFLVVGGLISSLTGMYLGIIHVKERTASANRSSIPK
jgi:hypothetical protein